MGVQRTGSGSTYLAASLLLLGLSGSTLGCSVGSLPLDERDQALVELGRHLFYERRLSLNNDRACGICHEQAKGFTDGFVRAVGTTGEVHPRNTLTLLNAGSRDTLSWLAPDRMGLTEHVLIPLLGTQPVEMGMADIIEARLADLSDDETYRVLLSDLSPPRSALDLTLISEAIASFVAELSVFDAPYDRHLAGVQDAWMRKRSLVRRSSSLTPWGALHVMVAPTLIKKARSVTLGLTRAFTISAVGHPPGRQGLFELTGVAGDIGRYRVPTLRHLRFTGPYYHDGTGATLADVLENYNRGGRLVTSGPYVGDGRESPFRDPRIQPLGLSGEEMKALEAFLLSLSNEAVVTRPSWSDPWPRD